MKKLKLLQLTKAQINILIGLGLSLVIIALRLLGFWQGIELQLVDFYLKLKPSEKIDERIILVGVTEKDIQQLQVNRLSDLYLTKLIKKIESDHPIAIGLDIYRDHPVAPSYQELFELSKQGTNIFKSYPIPPGHEDFLNLFKDYSNLFAIGKFLGIKNDPDFERIAPPPIPENQQTGSDVSIDPDGIQRMAYLWPITEPPVKSLAWALTEVYLKHKKISLRLDDKQENLLIERRIGNQIIEKIFYVFNDFSGPYVNTDDSGYLILVNWRKAKFKVVSITDVMEGKVSSGTFRDRLVFVGAYAPSLKDQFLTPLSLYDNGSPRRLHGIEIQAQVASQILSTVFDKRSSITVWTEPWISAWICLWGLLGAICVLHFGGEKLIEIVICLLGAMIGLFVLGFATFLQGHWISVVPAALAILLSGSITLAVDNYWRIFALNKRLKSQLDKQRAYRLLAILGNDLAQNLVPPFSYLQNSFVALKNLDKNLSQIFAELSNQELKQRGINQSAKLLFITQQQKEQLDKIRFNLGMSIPNLEGLVQNDFLDLGQSSLSLTQLLDRLIKNSDSVFYDCYQVDLKSMLQIKLSLTSLKIYDPMNLLVSIYVIIDEIIKVGRVLQNQKNFFIKITDEVQEEIYTIMIITDCIYHYKNTDFELAVEERLNQYQAVISQVLLQNLYCWKIQLPLSDRCIF
ncbi:putative Chase2 sensor protein (plasmid) [Gloeothece citriformis PCC 7424]|uniref:Putative Chase2 sensor protein n=1 Tax=Gloeothece citriformis (strain PCC 7424) TaxID=65393 RepID=B7KLP8_GLOC7|nr:CHASE2 domain-containing protein [Gloeothece citriformis]ACK73720.1 putative Chase2 sensor protein [Gloeothece citriformis PCC 7424]